LDWTSDVVTGSVVAGRMGTRRVWSRCLALIIYRRTEMAEMVYKTVIFISIVAVVVAVFILKSNLALAVSVAALVIAFILLLSKYW
jgi:hypothetical protein